MVYTHDTLLHTLINVPKLNITAVILVLVLVNYDTFNLILVLVARPLKF